MKKSTDYLPGDSVTGTFLGDATPLLFTKVSEATNEEHPSNPGQCELWQFNGNLYEPTLEFQLGTSAPEFQPKILGTV